MFRKQFIFHFLLFLYFKSKTCILNIFLGKNKREIVEIMSVMRTENEDDLFEIEFLCLTET